jgi:hypothetical protein
MSFPKSSIKYIIIVIIILAFLFFGYNVFYPEDKNMIDKPTPSVPIVSSSVIIPLVLDATPISIGLTGAGIVSVRENFYTNTLPSTIIFDSIQKINNNAIAFLNIYFPSIDINKINQLLKENGCNNDIQQIINNKKINILSYLLNENTMNMIVLSIYTSDNKTNIILFGIYLILMWDLSMNTTITNKFYYYNDNDTTNDFNIYFIQDISKANKNNIENVNNLYNIDRTDTSKIYKFSLNNIIKNQLIYNLLSNKLNKTNNEITDIEYNNYMLIFRENSKSLSTLVNYQLAISLLIANNDGNINNTTKIAIDIFNFLHSNNLTQSMKDFLNIKEDTPSIDNLIQSFKYIYTNRINN